MTEKSQEQEKPPAPPVVTDAGADGEVIARQFVIFIVGGEAFAVDMAPVQEIIRVPSVVRMPGAPHTLDGLANLRGKVLPIISLRRIFGMEPLDADDSTRAVVISEGQSLGFVVDRVVSVVGVEPKLVEDTSAIGTTGHSEYVSGLLKNQGGHEVVMVLDFTRLVAGQFNSGVTQRRATQQLEAVADTTAEDLETSDELQLVSFEVDAQEYAIAIEDVQEIVQMPARIVRVPQVDSHVLGVMTLRSRILPLVSLRRMFGLPARSAEETSRIVVVSAGAASVGVVMDSVNEVLRVPRADVDALPALLAKREAPSTIAGICRIDGGKRLVSILSVGAMFEHAAVQEALQEAGEMREERAGHEAQRQAVDDEEQFVVFRMGAEEFGVPIDSVQEIVRVPEQLTQVARAPASVEGVINLRGVVMPVIDLRRRLGLGAIQRTDQRRIMVFLIDGVRTGFIVDSVAEVLKIHQSAIAPAPVFSTSQGGLLARMANLPAQKRLVQLLDPAHLIEAPERGTLAALAA